VDDAQVPASFDDVSLYSDFYGQEPANPEQLIMLQISSVKSAVWTPFVLNLDDVILRDSLDMDHHSGREELLEARPAFENSRSHESNGVLCQTLYHPSIHDQHFMPFAESGLGSDLAKTFDDKLLTKCKEAHSSVVWDDIFKNYTGNWTTNPAAALDNTIFGSMGEWLNEERKKKTAETKSWQDFRNGPKQKPQESFMLGLLKSLAGSSQITRIMDFGCGDGVELSKIARGLGLTKDDTFGLDIVDYVNDDVKGNMTFMNAEVSEYVEQLENLMDENELDGTVSVIFSQVTFHHITAPEMRTAALSFIRDALKPDGFFVLAEWDNSLMPIDYTIFFDLSHNLPSLFFSDPAPTTASLGPLNTEYLSIQGFVDLLKSNDLKYDVTRSNMPWMTHDNRTVNMTPWEAADKTTGRNFLAVFVK
jgi:SAM-dependent methyltransferase